MLRSTLAAAVLTALVPMGASTAATVPCGPDDPCSTANGSYHLAAPADWDGETPLPAVLWFHAYRGSGNAVVSNPTVPDPLNQRGYLVIAPNAETLPGRDVRSWAIQERYQGIGRNEVAFAEEVVEDVAARLPLDRANILVSGFSVGGSMAWYLACAAGSGFRGYAPIGGGFWEPQPEACPGGPVRLRHLHGYVDRTVPLEGRTIREGVVQGDIFAGLKLLREAQGCRNTPDRFAMGAASQCRIWQESCDVGELRLCLHEDGHTLPAGALDAALDWFEAQAS